MAYELFVGDKTRIEDRLNGALVIGPFKNTGLPVGGLTLIFATPAVTVTFSGSAGDYLTVDQIISEIRSAAPTLTVTKRGEQNSVAYSAQVGGGAPVGNSSIVLQLDTGITIDKDGTANPLLGIRTDSDIVGRAAVAQTEIAGFTQGSTPAHYAVLINLDPTP